MQSQMRNIQALQQEVYNAQETLAKNESLKGSGWVRHGMDKTRTEARMIRGVCVRRAI